MKSIAHRIYKAIFAISLICVVLIISTVLVVNEDLESTMLLGAKSHPAIPNIPPTPLEYSQPFIWDQGLNKIAYIPNHSAVPDDFPALFTLAHDKDQAEIDFEDSTYLINIERHPEGTFYWARNIDSFEQREKTLNGVLIIIVLLISALSLMLARYSSRKIVQPLQNLTHQINNLPIGTELTTLETHYQDRELNDIANTFNFFLSELNAHIQREKQLLNLASHELRTPIAVTSGALDVIEARQQLATNDAHTLQRIRRANDEMSNNVTILLQLARGTLQAKAMTEIQVQHCIQDAIHDLAVTYPVQERIQTSGQAVIKSHEALVKMLLRNVIQNALQHTSGQIHIQIDNEKICIEDEGTSAKDDLSWLTPTHSTPTSGGLGLYLVTLMCEKLDWKLDIQPIKHAGTCITLTYS